MATGTLKGKMALIQKKNTALRASKVTDDSGSISTISSIQSSSSTHSTAAKLTISNNVLAMKDQILALEDTVLDLKYEAYTAIFTVIIAIIFGVWWVLGIYCGLTAIASFCLWVYNSYTNNWCAWSLFRGSTNLKKDLRGYYAIVTGGSSGIGYAIARHLIRHGAHVTIASKNSSKGTKAAQKLNTEQRNERIYDGGVAVFIKCDMTQLMSIESFAITYQLRQYPLHILVNNAGILEINNAGITMDNIGAIIQTNFFSHFLITNMLLPTMKKSAQTNSKMDHRIVNTSCGNHDTFLNFKNLQHRGGLKESKLALILHATFLQKQFTKQRIPISICSVNPGAAFTNLFRFDTWYLRILVIVFTPALYLGLMTAEQASKTTLYCALAPVGDHVNTWGGEYTPGAYHVNLKPRLPNDKKRQSTSDKAMKELYDYSMKVLKL
eukprot:245989_1